MIDVLNTRLLVSIMEGTPIAACSTDTFDRTPAPCVHSILQ